MKKIFVCVMSLVILCFSGTVQAQDPCDSYHDRYRVCVEKRDAGREVDYNVCKNLSSQGQMVCEAAGCTWYENSPTQAFPCMLDICLMDWDGNNGVGALDFGIFKREQGRGPCPNTPSNPGYLGAPVEKTGQTTCYDSSGTVISCTGTGQDGEYQKGVAWPNPRFTNNGDGTVTDNLTGLMWLKDANCMATSYSGFDNDGDIGDGAVTWQHAFDFVAGINDGTYTVCGGNPPYNDWRLPNVRELPSLLDYGRYPALPSGHPFNIVTAYDGACHWTSTIHAQGWGGSQWVHPIFKVHFYWATVESIYGEEFNIVWPVRGGND